VAFMLDERLLEKLMYTPSLHIPTRYNKFYVRRIMQHMTSPLGTRIQTVTDIT
jgi:hypothetical protein